METQESLNQKVEKMLSVLDAIGAAPTESELRPVRMTAQQTKTEIDKFVLGVAQFQTWLDYIAVLPADTDVNPDRLEALVKALDLRIMQACQVIASMQEIN
jgi:hypothetical protein